MKDNEFARDKEVGDAIWLARGGKVLGLGIFSGLILTLAVIASPALSSSFLGVEMADPVWMIEGGQDAGTEKIVKNGDLVTSARLIPGGVATLDSDFIDAEKGKVVIARNVDLFLYNVGSVHFYCSSSATKIGGGLIPCLIDSDGDMRFDFSTKVALLPSTGRFGAAIPLNKKPTAIAAIGYHKLDAAAATTGQVIKIRVQGLERPRYQAYFQVNDKEIPIRGLSASGKGVLPFSVELLGARFQTMSISGKEARIRIERALPSQPFQISNGVL
jgi:hypothetical protein